MTTIDDLKTILDETILVLSSARETNWNKTLSNFRNRCDSISDYNDQRLLISDILRIYGGMGSFSDLILYDQGSLLQNETAKLDALRSKLFETTNLLI